MDRPGQMAVKIKTLPTEHELAVVDHETTSEGESLKNMGIIYITSQILKICLFPKIQYLPLTKNSIRLFNGRVLKVPLVGYLLNTAPWGFGKMESKEVLVE